MLRHLFFYLYFKVNFFLISPTLYWLIYPMTSSNGACSKDKKKKQGQAQNFRKQNKPRRKSYETKYNTRGDSPNKRENKQFVREGPIRNLYL